MARHPEAFHCERERPVQKHGAGQLYLQDVLIRPQQESVLAQCEGDIVQLRQVAAVSIHYPQVVIGRVCQPCDVLRQTLILHTLLKQVSLCLT